MGWFPTPGLTNRRGPPVPGNDKARTPTLGAYSDRSPGSGKMGGVPVKKIRGVYRRVRRALAVAVAAFGRAWKAGEVLAPGHAIRWPMSGTWTHCSGAVEARDLFLGAKANGEPVERWQDGVRKDWWPR